MSRQQISITEHDTAGNLVTTYLHSVPFLEAKTHHERQLGETHTRIDVIKRLDSKTSFQRLLDVFLPAGFPHSVTEDYVMYQVYDSLQAFSSSIAGLISSRAVLEGVGVGDSTASPTAALLLSIVQDTMGRIATILFAYRLGSAFEPECKMYRLSADIFNDAAMVLDCLSPAFPKVVRVGILSASSVLRALCGVAAGSSKASLSAHFAKWGNLGELNAKDSSQETVISLLGMLAGSVLVPRITSQRSSWIVLLLLLSIHLSMNYMAVRSVSMRSLNRQRANIVFSTLLTNGRILTPQEVSRRERIFERDGVLRWGSSGVLGHCRVGTSYSNLLRSTQTRQHSTTGSFQNMHLDMARLFRIFSAEKYILWYSIHTAETMIVLKQGATATDQLRAWAQALAIAKTLQRKSDRRGMLDDDNVLTTISETLTEVSRMFREHAGAMSGVGWDFESAALETWPGTRIVYENKSKD